MIRRPAFEGEAVETEAAQGGSRLGNYSLEHSAVSFDLATRPLKPSPPPVWLLGKACDGGADLTATFALSRAITREAAELWPKWWHAELFGPPHREADLRPLEQLHAGLKRLGLVRRRARKLHATKRGRELLGQPGELMAWMAADLGGEASFADAVAEAVVDALMRSGGLTIDELEHAVYQVISRQGWRDLAGNQPDLDDVRWQAIDVVSRGEGYGLIVWERGMRERSKVSVTAVGRRAIALAWEHLT